MTEAEHWQQVGSHQQKPPKPEGPSIAAFHSAERYLHFLWRKPGTNSLFLSTYDIIESIWTETRDGNQFRASIDGYSQLGDKVYWRELPTQERSSALLHEYDLTAKSEKTIEMPKQGLGTSSQGDGIIAFNHCVFVFGKDRIYIFDTTSNQWRFCLISDAKIQDLLNSQDEAFTNSATSTTEQPMSHDDVEDLSTALTDNRTMLLSKSRSQWFLILPHHAVRFLPSKNELIVLDLATLQLRGEVDIARRAGPKSLSPEFLSPFGDSRKLFLVGDSSTGELTEYVIYDMDANSIKRNFSTIESLSGEYPAFIRSPIVCSRGHLWGLFGTERKTKGGSDIELYRFGARTMISDIAQFTDVPKLPTKEELRPMPTCGKEEFPPARKKARTASSYRNKDQKCVLCMSRSKGGYALQPCGHRETCLPCGRSLIESKSGCPECKNPVTKVEEYSMDSDDDDSSFFLFPSTASVLANYAPNSAGSSFVYEFTYEREVVSYSMVLWTSD